MARRKQRGRGFLSFFRRKKKTRAAKKRNYYNRYQRGQGQKGGNPAAAMIAKKAAKDSAKIWTSSSDTISCTPGCKRTKLVHKKQTVIKHCAEK